MKPLNKVIKKLGNTYTQVAKTDKGYIYHVQSGNDEYWEVFQYVENTRFDCVSYPKNESFGKWAWCTISFEKAKKYLENL